MSLASHSSSYEQVLPIRFPLVNRFYKQCGYSVHCGRLEQVHCLRTKIKGDSVIIAAARFLPQENQYLLLRNLCVDPQWRQRGLARKLMQHSLSQINPVPCYCFAHNYLQNFYESMGFVVPEPEQIPDQIAESYQRHSQQQSDLLLLGLI